MIEQKFFKIREENKTKAQCQKCHGIYSHCSCGSAKLYTTFNLMDHLKKKHFAEYEATI